MMRIFWLRLCLCGMFCALTPLLQAHAQVSPADKAAAEALFDRGLSLMRQGKFEEACPKLEQSQGIDRGIGTLLYLGDCYEHLGRTASAWAQFREAASLAQAAGQQERAEMGKHRADRLEPKLSRLTIKVASADMVPGLVITRNGTQVANGVWGVPVPVDPGEQKIEASAEGYESLATTIVVEADGSSAELVLPGLKRSASAPEPSAPVAGKGATPAPGAQPTPAAPSRTQRIVGLSLIGAGAASAVVGAAFGIRAIRKNNEAEEVCDGAVCSTKHGETLTDRALKAARTSTATISIGAAFLAAGLVTYFIKPRDRRADVAVSADRNGAAVLVGGVF